MHVTPTGTPACTGATALLRWQQSCWKPAGADANALNRRGESPLHRQRDAAVVAALLEAGADVSLRDNSGATALHFAAARGTMSAAGMELMVAAGRRALLGARDNEGRRALFFAVRNAYSPCWEPLLALLHAHVREGLNVDEGERGFLDEFMRFASLKVMDALGALVSGLLAAGVGVC